MKRPLPPPSHHQWQTELRTLAKKRAPRLGDRLVLKTLAEDDTPDARISDIIAVARCAMQVPELKKIIEVAMANSVDLTKIELNLIHNFGYWYRYKFNIHDKSAAYSSVPYLMGEIATNATVDDDALRCAVISSGSFWVDDISKNWGQPPFK